MNGSSDWLGVPPRTGGRIWGEQPRSRTAPIQCCEQGLAESPLVDLSERGWTGTLTERWKMLMVGERLGAVCAGTVRLEENLRLVGRLEAKNPETGKDGSCCCRCCCWQLPLVAMGSETLFSLRSSFFSFIPTLFGAFACQVRNTALRFSFFSLPSRRSFWVSAQRQNQRVFPGIRPFPKELPLRT